METSRDISPSVGDPAERDSAIVRHTRGRQSPNSAQSSQRPLRAIGRGGSTPSSPEDIKKAPESYLNPRATSFISTYGVSSDIESKGLSSIPARDGSDTEGLEKVAAEAEGSGLGKPSSSAGSLSRSESDWVRHVHADESSLGPQQLEVAKQAAESAGAVAAARVAEAEVLQMYRIDPEVKDRVPWINLTWNLVNTRAAASEIRTRLDRNRAGDGQKSFLDTLETLSVSERQLVLSILENQEPYLLSENYGSKYRRTDIVILSLKRSQHDMTIGTISLKGIPSFQIIVQQYVHSTHPERRLSAERMAVASPSHYGGVASGLATKMPYLKFPPLQDLEIERTRQRAQQEGIIAGKKSGRKEPSRANIMTPPAEPWTVQNQDDTASDGFKGATEEFFARNQNFQKPAALKLEAAGLVKTARRLRPQLVALLYARPILDINYVSYPTNIVPPQQALDTTAPARKFRYDTDFLMQFEKVFREKPVLEWDMRMREIFGDRRPAQITINNEMDPNAYDPNTPIMRRHKPSDRDPIAAVDELLQKYTTLFQHPS